MQNNLISVRESFRLYNALLWFLGWHSSLPYPPGVSLFTHLAYLRTATPEVTGKVLLQQRTPWQQRLGQ